MSANAKVAFGHAQTNIGISSPPVQKPTGSMNMTKVISLIVVLIIVIAMVVINKINGMLTRGSTTVSEVESVERQTTATDQFDIPARQIVMVDTKWYDPNTKCLALNVMGNPAPNTGNDVLWQMKADDDDSTIQNMPPINSPTQHCVVFTNAATIKYRVTPGQKVTKVPFIFRFSPSQKKVARTRTQSPGRR
ncbi:MAG: hypothetical protein WC648_04280 [Candidatus Paceibacterota bacterium]|jgi:hypothetical protein